MMTTTSKQVARVEEEERYRRPSAVMRLYGDNQVLRCRIECRLTMVILPPNTSLLV